MCIKTTLDKMLTISRMLSELSVEKMNIAGEIYKSSKFETSPKDTIEGVDTSLENSLGQFSAKITEAFVYILNFILTKSDDETEMNAIYKNTSSYLDILKSLVEDRTLYAKQKSDKSINELYDEAETKLKINNKEDLKTQLLLCKRAIFE